MVSIEFRSEGAGFALIGPLGKGGRLVIMYFVLSFSCLRGDIELDPSSKVFWARPNGPLPLPPLPLSVLTVTVLSQMRKMTQVKPIAQGHSECSDCNDRVKPIAQRHSEC